MQQDEIDGKLNEIVKKLVSRKTLANKTSSSNLKARKPGNSKERSKAVSWSTRESMMSYSILAHGSWPMEKYQGS